MSDIIVTGRRIKVAVGRRDRNGRRIDSDDQLITDSAQLRNVVQREVSEGEAEGDKSGAKVYVVVQIEGLG